MQKQLKTSLKNRVIFREEQEEEFKLWKAIVICFVKSQVLFFVFTLICNHLADQKYP